MSMGRHLSYANVMATIAVFVALGGTSYAIATLPKNSVGSKQIRSGAVGKTEVRRGAVRSKQLHDGSVSLRDLSATTKASLRGQTGSPGPPGPASVPFSAAVNSGGAVRSTSGGHLLERHEAGTGMYVLSFDRDMTACYAVASLSKVDGGIVTLPNGGEIVTEATLVGVNVRTRNSSGQPADLPFHVLISC
jgi:hypothetical protein